MVILHAATMAVEGTAQSTKECILCHVMFFLQIHEEMVSKTAWDNEMKSFSWRIDACSQARHVPRLNNTCAIAELQLGPRGKPVRTSSYILYC